MLGLLVGVGILATIDSSITAKAVAAKMGLGWNLGDTLESTSQSEASETLWGNPKASQELINLVLANGFNTIRLPCAWNAYLKDKGPSYTIDPDWLARVKEVVDYVVSKDAYALLNIHWDGGWFEEHMDPDQVSTLKPKLTKIWEQIAKEFIDYDEHLIFCGANEPWGNSGDETGAATLGTLMESFVTTVRGTGGNNRYRPLAVQAYSTNIQMALDYFKLPSEGAGRLFMEIHYYDPWSFCGETNSGEYLWGKEFANSGHVANWAQEDWVDDRFSNLKSAFVDKNIPVILGEYSVTHRINVNQEPQADVDKARYNWLAYVTKAAVANGVVPVYWDNGHTDSGGCALFDRNTLKVFDQGGVDAVVKHT